jgi:2-polyprenyl-6-methoxyphenol hydroxylase-like FAD-dependent oxidoreductase
MANTDKSPKTPPKTGNAEQVRHRPAVLVVGAGPTGLLLAAELQRRGVPCHLIDARPAPLHWDRATVVHPRSLEVFEAVGLIDRFLVVGCKQRTVKIHSRGQVLGIKDLSTCGSSHGFNLGLSEEVTESILTDYLHQQGGEVNRSSRLIGLTPRPVGVLADIERDGIRYQVDAQWVVGCDGLHSKTRELSGIGFEGHDINKPWAVFDTTLQGWAETFEANFVYLETPPVVLTALPGRRWRVYTRPGSPDADFVAEAASIIRLYAPAVTCVDVENPTRFLCHTKVATKFRSGAVFLAGDAAHVCSPAEGHGMNCGLQDAFNLAWKLALVHRGAAAPALLDSYEAERRPVAEMIAQSGDLTDWAQTIVDPTELDKRDQNIKARLADSKTRHHEVVAEAELNVNYSQSPIVCGNANSVFAPGNCLPTTIHVQKSDGLSCRLHEFVRAIGHTLLLLGGPAVEDRAFIELHAALREFVTDSPLFGAAIALSTQPELPGQIGRLEPDAAALLGIQCTTLLAVRPDGYVGLRSDGDHVSALEHYCRLVICG